MGADELDGKVGRIYMPKQDVDNIALRKMKVGDDAGCERLNQGWCEVLLAVCQGG